MFVKLQREIKMKEFVKFILTILLGLLLFGLFLTGCVQNASETAAETSLHQVSAIEQQIKKECPAAKIDEPIKALKSSINTQLAVCESQKDTLQERNNTLMAILIGLIAIIVVIIWVKIKSGVLKCVSRFKNS